MFQGFEVPRYYDPMLGKLISYGHDREEARRHLSAARDFDRYRESAGEMLDWLDRRRE